MGDTNSPSVADVGFDISPLSRVEFKMLTYIFKIVNKGNNKITELRTILQRESQNSLVYKQTKSVNNGKL